MLVLAPTYMLLPGDPGNGIYAVLALGLVCLATVWVLGRRISGTWGGTLAFLALLAQPDFRLSCRQIMSDVPTLAFALPTCWLYTRMKPSSSLWQYAAVGVLAASACAMREVYLILLLPFALLIARRERGRLVPALLLALPMAVSLGINGALQSAYLRLLAPNRLQLLESCPV